MTKLYIYPYNPSCLDNLNVYDPADSLFYSITPYGPAALGILTTSQKCVGVVRQRRRPFRPMLEMRKGKEVIGQFLPDAKEKGGRLQLFNMWFNVQYGPSGKTVCILNSERILCTLSRNSRPGKADCLEIQCSDQIDALTAVLIAAGASLL